MNKKGQVFDNLGYIATGVLSLTMVLVFVFLIATQARSAAVTAEGYNPLQTNYSQTDSPTRSVAFNSSNTMINAVAGIPGWVPLVILAFIGAILLGLVKLFR